MGCDDLPLASRLNPAIREAVVIVVRLAVGLAFFMIGARHNRDVAVRADLQVAHFRELHFRAGISGMADVSRLTVHAPIFYRDHEFIREQRGEDSRMAVRPRTRGYGSAPHHVDL